MGPSSGGAETDGLDKGELEFHAGQLPRMTYQELLEYQRQLKEQLQVA